MNWLTLGFKLVPILMFAVEAVERLVTGKGRTKQDAAMELVRRAVQSLELVVERDVIDDAGVQAAARQFVDAYVSLQNAVQTAKATSPAPPSQ